MIVVGCSRDTFSRGSGVLLPTAAPAASTHCNINEASGSEIPAQARRPSAAEQWQSRWKARLKVGSKRTFLVFQYRLYTSVCLSSPPRLAGGPLESQMLLSHFNLTLFDAVMV
ncbi:hypothetical protein AMECASPLE_017219 [Ameca splendens]|uniref:Uncharacterized protein n=1 Tax=Ameca splendens TaxID=208324 RepID=A0ABV0ZBN2_9TELE